MSLLNFFTAMFHIYDNMYLMLIFIIYSRPKFMIFLLYVS
jgi:hypothetical protein